MELDKTGYWPPGRCASPGERFRRLKQALSDIYHAPNTTEYVRDVAINALKEGGQS